MFLTKLCFVATFATRFKRHGVCGVPWRSSCCDHGTLYRFRYVTRYSAIDRLRRFGGSSTLKMKAGGSSETFIPIYQNARSHIPEECNFNVCQYGNSSLISYSQFCGSECGQLIKVQSYFAVSLF